MLLFWYVIAKVAETADVALWNATGGLVAGHMIKHVAAAIGGVAVAAALRRASVTDHGATARDPVRPRAQTSSDSHRAHRSQAR